MGKYIAAAITTILFILTSIEIESTYPTPKLKKGFPITIPSHSMFKANEGAVVADLDGDGELEIIMNSANELWAINPDGSIVEGFPVRINNVMQHSPSVGDLDGDGRLEIVAQARESEGNASFVYAFDHNGTIREGYPITFGNGFHFAPVLFDLYDNGKLEIVVVFQNNIYLLNYLGKKLPGWPVSVDGTVSAKPSIGDIDGDGIQEIIISTNIKDKISGTMSGKIYAISIHGDFMNGFPVSADSLYGFNGSDPVLADFDGDGSYEIVVVMRNESSSKKSITVVYNGSGDEIRRWQTGYLGKKISLGDIDGDNVPEVFTWSWKHVYANSFRGNELNGWPIEIQTHWSQFEGAIGNIDSVKGLEMIYGSASTQYNYGWLSGHDQYGTSLLWSPLRPVGYQLSVPLLTDLESDGSVDIVITTNSHADEKMYIYAYEITGSKYKSKDFPWPMYGHDRYHTGQYGFAPND